MNRYLKYILIASGFYIISTLICYFISKPFTVSFSFTAFHFLILSIILIVGMYRFRDMENQSLDYGERFKFCFLTSFVSNIPLYFLMMTIYKVDSEIKYLMYESQINFGGGLLGIINKFTNSMDKYQIEEQKVTQMLIIGDLSKFDLYSGSMIFQALLNSLFLCVIYALILSLFVSSEKMSLKERWRRIDF